MFIKLSTNATKNRTIYNNAKHNSKHIKDLSSQDEISRVEINTEKEEFKQSRPSIVKALKTRRCLKTFNAETNELNEYINKKTSV